MGETNLALHIYLLEDNSIFHVEEIALILVWYLTRLQ